MSGADAAAVVLLLAQLVVLLVGDAVGSLQVRSHPDLVPELLVLLGPLLAVGLVAFNAVAKEAVFHPFVPIEKGGRFDLPTSIALLFRRRDHWPELADEPLKMSPVRF